MPNTSQSISRSDGGIEVSTSSAGVPYNVGYSGMISVERLPKRIRIILSKVDNGYTVEEIKSGEYSENPINIFEGQSAAINFIKDKFNE